MNKKVMEKLKRQAKEGKIKAMFEYGIETDDSVEQKISEKSCCRWLYFYHVLLWDAYISATFKGMV